MPLWFVAREASKQVKVVLSGEGSDELFGGYTAYDQPGVVRARASARLDPGLTAAGRSAHPAGGQGRGLLECTSTPLRRRGIQSALRRLDHRPGPTGFGWLYATVYDQAEAAELDDVSTMQLVDINTWLPGEDILLFRPTG